MTLDIQTASFIVALATLLSGLLAAIIRGVWRLSIKLSGVETALRDQISRSRVEIEEKQDSHIRMFGETIAAMRQRVSDVELYAANNYVRRDGFYKVQENLENSIRALGDKIDIRLERMEAKIDSKT